MIIIYASYISDLTSFTSSTSSASSSTDCLPFPLSFLFVSTDAFGWTFAKTSSIALILTGGITCAFALALAILPVEEDENY